MRIVPSKPAPDDVEDYLAKRAAFDKAKAELEDAQARLIKTMEADQRKTYKWSQHGVNYSLTYVAKSVPVVDEVGLRKALTAKVFDRYTKRTLDRRAMEKAMDSGEIDPVTVSKFVAMKQSTPYLTFTHREATE